MSVTLPSPPAFRLAFERFLLTFTLGDHQAIYRTAIRALSLSPFTDDGVTSEGGNEERHVLLFTLFMEHLQMPLTFQAHEVELQQNCASLFNCFKLLPFKYMPIAEVVVRDIFVVLEIASKPLQQSELPTSGDTTSLTIIDEALQRGAERAIADVPGAVSLRAKLLPFQIEIVYRERPLAIRHLNSSLIEKLVIIPGIVVQASKPYLKALTLVIQCKDCGHRKILRVPMWKQGVGLPRVCDGGPSTSTESKCSLDPFLIVSESSQFVDMQTIKLQEFADDVPTGDVPRHLIVNVASGLVGRVSPGTRLIVVGVYSAFDKGGTSGKGGPIEASVRTGYLHALGIEPITKDLAQNYDKNLLPGSIAISTGAGFSTAEIEHFHRLAADPDIVSLLTQSIAPSICGSEEIKRSVACMLFGGSRKYLPDGTSTRGDIHLLLLGDPSTAKSQILKFVERVAPVAVYTSGKGSSAAGLTAALVRDNNGNYALEGGAMVLADGGVVCIDEFDKMRDDDRVAIHEAMEQQTISIAKAGINTVLTTQCAVLAAANPTFGCYDATKEASDQHNFEATILSRFDCIWLVRDQRDLERDRTIAKHVVSLYAGNKSGTGGSGEGPIPTNILRSFISYCRANCHPRLSVEAAKKLENFYVEIREQARCDGRRKRDQIPITVRQLESLGRLAESFAKMSLSSSANLAHVDEAMRLFRMSTVATSQSTLGSRVVDEEDRELVRSAEEALLQRLPIGGRASKATIVRDLRLRGLEPQIIAQALNVLIQKEILEERGDATVRRIQLGRL